MRRRADDYLRRADTNRRKVIVGVVDAGQHRCYKKEQESVPGGFTHEGVCRGAYTESSGASQAIACEATLPWQKDNQVPVRCPDPVGAPCELRAELQAASSTDGGPDAARAGPSDGSAECWDLQSCRGLEGGCPFALTELSLLKERIREVLLQSGWEEFLSGQVSCRRLPHHRLKIALAGCPNACSQPQIKDIGLIASLRPRNVRPDCNGCARCQQVCQENAIVVEDGVARLRSASCLGCGLCIKECPIQAIEAEELGFRISVGGRMGRHPVWAKNLPGEVPPSQVPRIVEQLIRTIIRESRPSERVSDLVQRLGAESLAKP